jgi:GT2 family glycosyltransferase
MVNIVLLVKDRPRLTDQALRSLYANTPQDQFNLLVMQDGSGPDVQDLMMRYRFRENCREIDLGASIGIVGWLRNVGASASERYFGRGEYLVQADNDLFFKRDWLSTMVQRMKFSERYGFKVLGGYRHPFHGAIAGYHPSYENGPSKESAWIEETDAVAGYMHFMEWETWDKFGPYDQHAKGVCQSDDFAYCRKIVDAGYRVGYVNPPVIINCGLTNSEGKPAVGHEHFRVNTLENVIYE